VGLWKTYRGFSGFWQWCLALSFVMGLGAASVGLWGEFTQASFMPSWWSRMPYGVNLASSLTAFMVGVPVASVVLETMTSNRVEKAQKESVNRISVVAWSNFTKAIHDLCSDERIGALMSTDEIPNLVKPVQEEHDLIMETLQQCRNTVGRNPNSAPTEIANLRTFLAQHVSILESRWEAVNNKFGREYQIRPKWNYILSMWQVLDTHVRLRRMEFQLDPMNDDSYTHILDSLMADKNPIFEFLSLHSGFGSQDGAVSSMMGLRSLMDAVLSFSDERLLWFVNNYSSRVGTSLKTYDTDAFSAGVFLWGLKIRVDWVTTSGWPAKAGRETTDTAIEPHY
jgi:hypothetical protein